MKQTIVAIFIITLLALCVSCSKAVERVYWPTDDWRPASPESVGFSSEKLLEAVTTLDFDANGLNSLLIIKDGYSILEAYRYPYGPDTLHNVNSVTKSITSTLYGIALDRKAVKGVSSKVLDYFPEFKASETDGRKRAMTVEDLLTMRTGQNWIEYAGFDMDTSFDQMRGSENWLEYLLGIPMIGEPGETFDYNTGASHIISGIVQKGTGGTEAFARYHLFGPLGIQDYAWKNDPQGIPTGGFGLSLRARDLAKIGFLYLNGGIWDGERIVSREWTKKATAVHVDGLPAQTGSYGFHWWTQRGSRIFMAQGYGDQYLVVIPEQDVIIVTNAKPNSLRASSIISILGKYIPQSIISNDPLPENEAAVLALRDACTALSLPPEKKQYALPDRITETGITAVFGPNKTGILRARFFSSPEGTLRFELVYHQDGFPEVAVPLEAGTDNRYRMSIVFFPESRFLFDGKPSPVACRVIDSDEVRAVIEILPVGVVNVGPFVVNISFDVKTATLTYMDRFTHSGTTVVGTIGL